MHYRQINFYLVTALIFLSLTMTSYGMADEKIIKQETISFNKCLNIIAVSEDRLSITPKIIDDTDQKRIAIFTLTDGALTITCDGVRGNVIVSTSEN